MKFSVPPPVLVTLTEAGAGFTPLPCVALNERVVPESDSTAGGGATVNVAVIVAGEPVAPEAVTVICPV